MAHEFKAGDLALLIRSETGANTGKVVELIRFDSSEKILLPEEGRGCFTSNPKREPCWVICGDFESLLTPVGFVSAKIAACPQSWLMPLRGDFQLDQQKAKETEQCA